MMPDREKVIKGLEAHEKGCGYRSHYCDVMECPYRYGDESCDIEEMCHDALTLLKEQDAEIDEIADEYLDLGSEMAKQPEIVRCKNCKHYRINTVYPGTKMIMTYCEKTGIAESRPDWYCADGERKD